MIKVAKQQHFKSFLAPNTIPSDPSVQTELLWHENIPEPSRRQRKLRLDLDFISRPAVASSFCAFANRGSSRLPSSRTLYFISKRTRDAAVIISVNRRAHPCSGSLSNPFPSSGVHQKKVPVKSVTFRHAAVDLMCSLACQNTIGHRGPALGFGIPGDSRGSAGKHFEMCSGS